MTAAQSAKKEVPTSPLVSQALAAACIWLMTASAGSKTPPEGMWNTLADLKVSTEGKSAGKGEDALPLWLKDRFLLGASPDGELCHIFNQGD